MVDVLENNLRPEAKELIEYREWSIKTREGVQLFNERAGKVIPTLCINGVKVFESLIPTIDELYQALIDGARSDQQRLILRDAWQKADAEYGQS